MTRRYLVSGKANGALLLSHHIDGLAYLEIARSLPTVFSGRRRLAAITGPVTVSSALDRLEGWQRATRAAGFDGSLIENVDWSEEAGADGMRRLLERGGAIPADVAITTVDNDRGHPCSAYRWRRYRSAHAEAHYPHRT